MDYLKKIKHLFIIIILVFFKLSSSLLANDQIIIEVGDSYYDSQYDDWSIKCIKAPEDIPDPCQLYQQLYDSTFNPVADIHIFNLEEDSITEMGGSLTTPLETLLPPGIILSVDGGARKVYQFSFCISSGCIARIGFTADDIISFKKGNFAHAYIYSARNPDFEVKATLSLKGFTAAFKALKEKDQND